MTHEYYVAHKDHISEVNKKWRDAHKEELKQKRHEHYLAHKDEVMAKTRAYSIAHPEVGKEARKQWRERNREHVRDLAEYNRIKRKLEVLAELGEVCACCGNDDFEFLTVDHINGGGHQHRTVVGIGGNFYNAVLRDPDAKSKYRVLCMNCNFALGMYGRCPHKEKT